MSIFEALESGGVPRAFFYSEESSGLRAIVVLDDLRAGPAAGGARTKRYPSEEHALADAMTLARAMTLKCALGGLSAGGGKCVVMEHDGLDRPRAFEALGAHIERLHGQFRTAGDLGTTSADLAAMSRSTQYVHLAEASLVGAVARGLLRCVEVCASRRGVDVRGLRIGVEGAGNIGAAVARALRSAGAHVIISDLDVSKAEAVGVEVRSPSGLRAERLDIYAPCAVGGVIDAEYARTLDAWAVCGAANNVLASREAGAILRARGVIFVPDVIASAGAVIDGVGETVMGMNDRGPLIDALGPTCRAVLELADIDGTTETEAAQTIAALRMGAIAGSR